MRNFMRALEAKKFKRYEKNSGNEKQIKEEEKNGIEKDEEQDIKNQKKNFMKMMF
jgi:hypothetical protein